MEHQIYLAGIKSVLKTSGLSYQDLAAKLSMSESGVKKMLNGKDISFRRILQICDLLGIRPSQVLKYSEMMERPVMTLTSRQEEALLKNRILLRVFWRVSVEKLNQSQILVAEKIKAPELQKNLQQLVSLGLIEKRKSEFFSLHSGLFRLDEKSKLTQHLNREWSELTLSRALRSSNLAKFHRLLTLQTSEENYQRMMNKIEKTLSEIVDECEESLVRKKKGERRTFTVLVASVLKGVLEGDHSL